MGQTMNTPPVAEEHVYLMGHAPFPDYLRFMSEEPIDARELDQKRLADDWRAASDYFGELSQREAGWADKAAMQPLPQALQLLTMEVLTDPIYQRAFTAVPVEIGLVELDRLVIFQKDINLAHVQRLQEGWGTNPSAEAVLRFCLPFDHRCPSCRVGKVPRKDELIFLSDSNDLRFLECVVLRPDELINFQPLGPIAGIVGIVIGYGSNYLNVISCEGRLVLNNGYHRAYTLRALGVTHVPCVVQMVTRREELSVVAGTALRRNPDLYLSAPRPPLLKDFFDARLSHIVRLAPKARQVRVGFTIEEISVPCD